MPDWQWQRLTPRMPVRRVREWVRSSPTLSLNRETGSISAMTTSDDNVRWID